MRTEMILPLFVALVVVLGTAVVNFPIGQPQSTGGCQWCGDDPACRWADRERCR